MTGGIGSFFPGLSGLLGKGRFGVTVDDGECYNGAWGLSSMRLRTRLIGGGNFKLAGFILPADSGKVFFVLFYYYYFFSSTLGVCLACMGGYGL